MARGSKSSSNNDRILIPQSVSKVKEEEDIAAEMSEDEEAAYNSDEDMPNQSQVEIVKSVRHLKLWLIVCYCFKTETAFKIPANDWVFVRKLIGERR
jgi:hypothetical protein